MSLKCQFNEVGEMALERVELTEWSLDFGRSGYDRFMGLCQWIVGILLHLQYKFVCKRTK